MDYRFLIEMHYSFPDDLKASERGDRGKIINQLNYLLSISAMKTVLKYERWKLELDEYSVHE